MKKIFSILMVLCLLCTAAAAFADAAEETVPSLLELPELKTFDPDAVIEESDYEGEWVMKYAYIGDEPATPEQLAEKGFTIRPLTVHEGKLIDTYTDEEGAHETAIAYEFDADIGQISIETEDGSIIYVLDLLEDDNIMVSIVLYGEGDPVCISLYMVRPE